MSHSHKNKKVFVAMSGGVDSSVAAALLIEAGYHVEGVTMCFGISHPDSRRPSCCGVDGINDAREVARILNIHHHVLDFSEEMKDAIVENFIEEYLDGRTPNPCVRCNQFLKFGRLLEMVKTMNFDFLATGHYARIDCNAQAGCYELKKARDSQKDQSYFLHGIKKEALPKILFPLGDLTKKEVRALAKKYRLNTAEKPASQDLCFAPNGYYKDFVNSQLGKAAFMPGFFKNDQGEVVGEHKGLVNYTVGQRDGLGIALGRPVYIYKMEPETNTIYIGEKDCLFSNGLIAKEANFVSTATPLQTIFVTVHIRYNHPGVTARLTPMDGGQVRIEFAEPQMAVTPGQSAVFYDGDVLIGGAIIERALPCPKEAAVLTEN